MANTLYHVYETQPVRPVGTVPRVNKYKRQEEDDSRDNASFTAALARAKTKKTENETDTNRKNADPLRVIAGMSQYNRQARETFFILMNQADYRA